MQQIAWFNPYSRVVDAVRGLLAGDVAADAPLAAVARTAGLIELTQIGAARRFAAAVRAD